MKRNATGLLVVALALSYASAVTAYTGRYTPGKGITGTVHDLGRSHDGTNHTAVPEDSLSQRTCIFCHAEHNAHKLSPSKGGPRAGVGSGPQAPAAFDYLPLWNRELAANSAFYTMYQNGPGAPRVGSKASQAIYRGMTPGGVSLLCLSCHDGSAAVNTIIGKNSYLGNHHPIGFNYDAVRAMNTEIRSADTAELGGAGTVREHLYGEAKTTMECATCHSVHNMGNTGEALLWRSDANSQLCLTCHNKGTDPGNMVP